MGKPFSTAQCPWSKSHRRLLKAAKSDVNQGEPRARQAVLTAGSPGSVSGPGLQRDLVLAGCLVPRAAGGCSQLLEEPAEPKEAPCPLQFP